MEVNEKLLGKLKYNQDGLIPVIIQDEHSRQVLMLAYMNEISLKKTLESGQTCFYSRSRKKLWVKGETSGHTQRVCQVLVDCDCDTLLILVEQKGVACHTGAYSCFFRDLDGKQISYADREEPSNCGNVLDELTKVFEERKKNPILDSYVCHLMSSPEEKMPKKIVEEAAEVLIALKDKDKKQIIYETADLWFHSLVALSYYGISYRDILNELKHRRRKKKNEYER